MTIYNRYLKNHFSECRHIANARDEHRNRDVRLYAIPGVFDWVGVFDGVDAWVAPTIIQPFSVDVRKLLSMVAAGERIDLERPPPKRRHIALPPGESPPPQQPPSRRRIVTADSAPQSPVPATANEQRRERRVIHL